MTGPKKSLGQHWLKDRDILGNIADDANIGPDDTVLEIGPGLGTLTSELLRRAKKVIAVELMVSWPLNYQNNSPVLHLKW